MTTKNKTKCDGCGQTGQNMIEGWCAGAGHVTHIGEKGYAYCGPCAKERRASGYERCRKLLVRERKTLQAGGQLASYARTASRS